MNQRTITNILAVDDNPDNLFLLESVLDENSDYRVQSVEDGGTALECIRRSPPDLILLDIMMPGMDGYEVTRRIRQMSHIPYIPILLLTAHDQSSLVEGLDAGADDFVRKPFDVDELMARIRSMVRLKQSIDSYRYMVKQRDDFVARLTHDLRTPLIAANRVLELCLQGTFGSVSDDAQDALANVITNNANLLAMANTLLEVYRHDAGHKRMDVSPLSLRSLCDEVVQELAPLAQQKGLTLELEAEEECSTADNDGHLANCMVKGDRIELRRVITNLVGNAIKFTDSGHVIMRLRSPSEDTICLDVEDTGPGISQDDQRQIFEWFQQGDHMRAGSGLGLHLAQRIAQLHKGHISVRSTLGKGSIFELTLPLLQQNKVAMMQTRSKVLSYQQKT
ncbi:MAG: hybrid sensor histidine kinase/response regulator [Leptolyngbyaceae bacterium]|nr:hybrid sensor histidine kinase/response regulator [Leptolyngbyaceae bacterium]